MNKYILAGGSLVCLSYLHDYWRSTRIRLTVEPLKNNYLILPRIPFTNYEPKLKHIPFTYRATYIRYNVHHDELMAEIKDRLVYEQYDGRSTFEVKPADSLFWQIVQPPSP